MKMKDIKEKKKKEVKVKCKENQEKWKNNKIREVCQK